MPPALCRLAGPRVAALVLTLLLSAIAPFAHAAVWEYPNSSSTTLTFGGSMGPTTIVTDARIGAIHFNSSFSSGTFTVLGNSSLTFGAAGVINDSAATPIFSVADNSYGYIFFGADGASLGKAFYLIESTGELRIRTDHSIDGSLASINLAGGELKQANAADYGTMTVGAVSGSGVINFGTAALVVGNEKNTTFSGQLSGGLENGGVRNIAVTKVGSGTWTLSGNNVNLIGDTQISAGTIKIANATGSVFGVGDVTVGSAGTLTGAGSFTGALTKIGRAHV